MKMQPVAILAKKKQRYKLKQNIITERKTSYFLKKNQKMYYKEQL